MSKKPETVVAYKGFDKSLQCRGYQFELGKTHEHAGAVKACASGFHACEYPLDVFSYYPPATSRFVLVELEGELSRHEGDSKIAAARITLKGELTIPEIVSRAVAWVTDRCKPAKSEHVTEDSRAASSTGYQGAASSTGYQGAASSTGYRGAASSTGDYGAASSTGYRGAASSTGYQGAASSTGYQGAASSTGYQGAASSTGQHGVALASGSGGRAMASETGAIVLVNYDDQGAIRHIRAAKVGEHGVEAGVWYYLDADGQFIAAPDEEIDA